MEGINKEISAEEKELDLFLSYIAKHRGLDLSCYRKNFLLRRLKVRFMATKVYNLPEYMRIIKKDPQEWNNFLNNLGINVSEFFRDPEVFLYFRDECLPKLIEEKGKKGIKTITCWSCGCAYGEEPYSLAIIFKEFLKERMEEFYIRIWATDIDEDALSKAIKGEYVKSALNKVDEKTLKKYFLPLSPDVYRLKDEIKRLVIFKKQNVFIDETLKSMDAIFLRNVRIYFNQVEAEKILIDMTDSLKKDGYLVLGKAETMPLTLEKFFEPLSIANKIFRRI